MILPLAEERVFAESPEAPGGAHRLMIAGEDWTKKAREITASYAGEDQAGGSELTFTPREALAGYEDARVVLYLDGVPWFGGKLKRAPDRGRGVQARALGPFSEMATQSFGEEVFYRGLFAESVLYDIARRASFPSGTVEVRGGRSRRVEELAFAEEVTLLEGAKAVMDSTGFVSSDMPGPYGKRLFMPRPRPGATGRVRRVFTEDDYPSDGLRITERHDSSYDRVVVFRRAEDGSYAVRQEAPVRQSGRFPAPKGRVYYIPEFAGDAKQAKQEAYDTARSLSAGMVEIELSGVWIDSEMADMAKYEQVEIQRVDERRDGLYREVYHCRIDSGVAAEVASWTMTMAGSAILVSGRKAGRARIVVDSLSAGVIRLPAPPRVAPPFTSWGQEDLALHEITGTYGELS